MVDMDLISRLLKVKYRYYNGSGREHVGVWNHPDIFSFYKYNKVFVLGVSSKGYIVVILIHLKQQEWSDISYFNGGSEIFTITM